MSLTKTNRIIISDSDEVIIIHSYCTQRQYLLCGTCVSRHDLRTILKTTPRKQATFTVTMTTCPELLYNREGIPVKKNRALFLVSFSQVCWVTALFYKSIDSTVWKKSYSQESDSISMRCWLCGLLKYVDVSHFVKCDVLFVFLNVICPKNMYFKLEIKYICPTLADYYVCIMWCSHIVWLISSLVYGDHLIPADRHAELYCWRM